MFNPGLYFKTLDLTKTKVLLNLGLESSVIWAVEFLVNSCNDSKRSESLFSTSLTN